MAEAISVLKQPSKIKDLILSIPFFIPGVIQTQEKYFRDLNRIVDESVNRIKMVGYDQPYIDSELTQKAFTKANEKGVNLEAIIPEEVETYLDNLKHRENVNIIRHPNQMINGFIIFDYGHIAFWDSTRKTVNPLERNKGVYRRTCIYEHYSGFFTAEKAERYFDRLKKEVSDKRI